MLFILNVGSALTVVTGKVELVCSSVTKPNKSGVLLPLFEHALRILAIAAHSQVINQKNVFLLTLSGKKQTFFRMK